MIKYALRLDAREMTEGGGEGERQKEREREREREGGKQMGGVSGTN
jgi:hypothetical protein